MSSLLLRDQTAGSGEWISRTRAALLYHAHYRFQQTPGDAEAGFIRAVATDPEAWARRFAFYTAAIVDGIGDVDPSKDPDKADEILRQGVAVAWDEIKPPEPKPDVAP